MHVKWEKKRGKDYICQLGCHMLFWPESSKNGDSSFLNENLCQLPILCLFFGQPRDFFMARESQTSITVGHPVSTFKKQNVGTVWFGFSEVGKSNNSLHMLFFYFVDGNGLEAKNNPLKE